MIYGHQIFLIFQESRILIFPFNIEKWFKTFEFELPVYVFNFKMFAVKFTKLMLFFN